MLSLFGCLSDNEEEINRERGSDKKDALWGYFFLYTINKVTILMDSGSVC